MAKLILIRHGQSTWNAANKFTGWVDVPLSSLGREQAMLAAHKLSAYRIDSCFTSLLIRAIETAVICLTERDGVFKDKSPVLKHNADDPQWHGWDCYEGDRTEEIPVFLSAALDERYYGDLQGLNKTLSTETFGIDQVHRWRRSFSVRPPGGESLADTAARTIPYFKDRILTHLQNGDNVLVSAHGNSLRSIVMVLDGLSQQAVCDLELATGIPIIYDVSPAGEITNKTILS
ncbi:phosphoglycerate mutase family protein, putative [Synechococcus sp. PCC 7335]|uniref:2,3-bisphosphoglycerate-dependent phosphoglycerate mutase n=1 Tax=Synechococcus sp. (strain ATCC 29403 / PCC 7335) TaxID=91464 RepID=UPI00017ECB5F|nr:2,3-bisphosphoglycerate-dependent phosphoglycerate mutase [Synechococcus sp. PCC 7335]EDX83381.1 phosphoglycerate mutase family protein, putative [Synechococcus sp. PCC 7335]